MRKKMIFVVSMLCLVVFTSTSAYAAGNNRIYAGTAKVDYTPDSVPDSLILDHQYVRVIAFSDGVKKALLVATELKWIFNPVWEELTKRIKEETGIDREYILISGVHTHCGVPPGDDFNNKVVACVKEALANLEPVNIGAGKGECKMSMNRREHAVDGRIILGRNPYGPCDYKVGVLRIDNDKEKPISVMINWPCHAVINFPKPKLYSGDWPGSTSKFMEKEFQGKVMVPVTIGASGDINPLYHSPYPPRDRKSRRKREGLAITAMYLGEEAVRVSNEIVTYPNGRISAAQRYLSLPGIKRISRLPYQEIMSGDDLRVRLTAVKVGNIVFAGFGGEVMTEIGMRLKELSPYRHTFVVTFCNGHCGYLVTDKALKEGGLEPSRSRGKPGTAKALVDNMLEMINGL